LTRLHNARAALDADTEQRIRKAIERLAPAVEV
jgi:hypothetical protein